jgi:hypothetical protein
MLIISKDILLVKLIPKHSSLVKKEQQVYNRLYKEPLFILNTTGKNELYDQSAL